MKFDRRTMIAGSAALAVSGPALSQRRPAPGWFDRAIVIDGLGGIRDPYEKDEITRWSQRGFDETMATGVTMLRDTIFPVGNVADPWGEYQKVIKGYHAFVAANPDRLIMVRSAADILKAKREKKFAILLGTQDSVMVGPELDRLAQLKKDGVLTVQSSIFFFVASSRGHGRTPLSVPIPTPSSPATFATCSICATSCASLTCPSAARNGMK